MGLAQYNQSKNKLLKSAEHRFFVIILMVLFVSLFADNTSANYEFEEISFNNELVDAADRGNQEEVFRLIRAGTPVDSRGNFGTTALMRAAFRGHQDIVKALIQVGADLDAVDIGGATALHIASRQGNNKIVDLILAANATVNIQDNDGWTPLMRAVSSKNSDIINSLLNKGADVHALNRWQQTALSNAFQTNNISIVQPFITHNKLAQLPNIERHRLAAIAKKHNNMELAYLVEGQQQPPVAIASAPNNVAEIPQAATSSHNASSHNVIVTQPHKTTTKFSQLAQGEVIDISNGELIQSETRPKAVTLHEVTTGELQNIPEQQQPNNETLMANADNYAENIATHEEQLSAQTENYPTPAPTTIEPTVPDTTQPLTLPSSHHQALPADTHTMPDTATHQQMQPQIQEQAQEPVNIVQPAVIPEASQPERTGILEAVPTQPLISRTKPQVHRTQVAEAPAPHQARTHQVEDLPWLKHKPHAQHAHAVRRPIVRQPVVMAQTHHADNTPKAQILARRKEAVAPQKTVAMKPVEQVPHPRESTPPAPPAQEIARTDNIKVFEAVRVRSTPAKPAPTTHPSPRVEPQGSRLLTLNTMDLKPTHTYKPSDSKLTKGSIWVKVEGFSSQQQAIERYNNLLTKDVNLINNIRFKIARSVENPSLIAVRVGPVMDEASAQRICSIIAQHNKQLSCKLVVDFGKSSKLGTGTSHGPDFVHKKNRKPKNYAHQQLYWIQVGSFKSEMIAEAFLHKLKKRSGNLLAKSNYHIVTPHNNSGAQPYYRLRIGAFKNSDEAEYMSNKLQALAVNAIIVEE